MTDTMPPVRCPQRLGWRPDTPDWRDRAYVYSTLGEARSSLTADQVIGSRLHEGLPVINQGRTSSCTGCAGSKLGAAVLRLRLRSALHLYFEARRMVGEEGLDNGAYLRDVIKVMNKLGTGRESWWPMGNERVLVDPPAREDTDAARHQVFGYSRLETPQDMHDCLAARFPFVIGSTLYAQFSSVQAASTGIIRMPLRGEAVIGGHAYYVHHRISDFPESPWGATAIAQGWAKGDLPPAAYRATNSWGSQWGAGGDFFIDSRYVEDRDLSDDSWTIRKLADPAAHG